MNKRNRFLTILAAAAAILIISGMGFGQQSGIDKQFSLAVDLYQSGQYSDALPIFRKIAVQEPYNPKTAISYLFTGKTYLQMNDPEQAKKYLQDFLEKFPASSYGDEAHLALAKVFYKEEAYKDAFSELLHLVSNAKLSGYQTYAESIGTALAINYLDEQRIKTFIDITTDSTAKPYLMLILAQKQKSEGNYSKAAASCSQLLKKYPGSKQAADASQMLASLKSIKDEFRSQNLLGVLLPLTDSKTGEPNPAANEILEGIKYSAARYNKEHEDKVGLVIRDTENDSSTIRVIAEELSTVPAIKAVIGPIFSDEVRATLLDLRDSGIPVISPTATDNDLVELSDNFFQANPSFYMRAKVMAQYIYYAAGKRKISILNAIQGYSPLLAAIFSEEFQKLGGEILKNRTYSSGSFDLNEPVSTIASDSSEIDGIYVPLSSKIDAAPLLSQMVQYNINTSIFGNQDWFYAKGFETSSVLSDQLSFTSDFYIDYNDTSFNAFSKDFTAETGEDINRNVLYGYDTAEYLMTIIDAGADTRGALISTMESGIEVKGYHNNIAFGREHINRFLNIVRYSDGKFELTDRFKSGE